MKHIRSLTLTILALFTLLTTQPGCSYLRSVTIKKTDAGGIVTEKTTVRAYSLWDGTANLTKFRNTTGGNPSNHLAGGTYIGSLTETSSSTNIVSLLGVVAEGVAKGVIAGAKVP